MNPILKASIAAAMTLGAVSAHAAFAVPSSSSPGDLILFGEVLNSSGIVVGSYAGDTGITVLGTQAAITANQTASMSDGGNLAKLLALDTGTNTLVWSIQGGGQVSSADAQLSDPGAGQFVTTATGNNTAQMALRSNAALNTWENFGNTTVALNKNIGLNPGATGGPTSVFGTATASAGIFDTTTISANPANWYVTGGQTGVSGLGTAFNLYGVTATDTNLALSILGTATLTANGVTFTAASSGTPVPLPAAIWLLGSGLLGLAGVGRRKIAVPTAA